MVSSEKTHMPFLALSPPLSATPSVGGSDSELDNTTTPQQADVRRLPRRRRQQSKTDSPPSSFTSSTGPVAHHLSPTSDARKAVKQEEEKKQEGRAQRGRGRGRRRRRIGNSNELETALSLIKAAWQRELSSDQHAYHVLHILPTEFRELRERLDDPRPLLDYFDNVLRFDYSPGRATLVLRLMATTVHEYLKEYFVDEVKEQLRALSKKHSGQHSGRDCRIPQIIPEIKWHGHARLDLEADVGSDAEVDTRVVDTKSPDGQTWYGTALSPQFILEIGYSQRNVSLQDLAMEYYTGSNGDIKTVLTLDIEYAKPSQRRLSRASGSADRTAVDCTSVLCLYRGPNRIHKDMVFRDAQGRATSNSLELLLSDFIPDDDIERFSRQTQHCIDDCTIHITAEVLCKLLAEAEAAQSRKDIRRRKREEDTPGQDVGQAPKKRLFVNWARDVIEISDKQRSSSPDDGRLESPKKRRTTPDRVYRSSSRVSGPSDRQTRSMSRGERREL